MRRLLAAVFRVVPLSLLVALAAFGTLPLWITQVGLYSYLGVEVLIWCLYALGYNLALGYTGLPSFGHGAFFGIGGYAFGLTQFRLAANLWLCVLASAVVAAVAGALVATFISHRRGIYYGLLTIAFGETFYFIATKWHTLTRGEDGLLNIKRLPVQVGSLSLGLTGNTQLYYFALAVFAIVAWLLWRLVRSPFGNTLQAIKQNDVRAAFLGYNVWLYKWLSFTLSAGIAGLAGGLFAMAQEGAYVQVMALHASGIVVLMTLVGGGLVSFWGPVFGTVVYFVARDLLGALTETWLLWYGLLFMAIIMFKPDGIAGIVRDVLLTWGAPGAPQAPRRSGHPGEAGAPLDIASSSQNPRGGAMALLEARGLHKRFGQQVVLEDVNVRVEAGRLHGIMGPNGAGKTTLFHVLTGLHRPDRGQVLLDGADITGWSPRAIAARGIARSFQAMTLFDEFTVLRNVLTAMPEVRARGFDMLGDLEGRAETVEAARDILGRVGLRERASAPARSLPYGDRRRLDIAIAIAARPAILFLDEPTAGLSGDAVARLADLIAELKRSLTIVLVEHNMAFLFGLADSVAVMHWGQVIAEGTPDELRADPWVKTSNLGKLA